MGAMKMWRWMMAAALGLPLGCDNDRATVAPAPERPRDDGIPTQRCPADDMDCWIGDDEQFAAARAREFERSQNDETRQQMAEQHAQTMDALAALEPESIEPSAWWCMRGTYANEAVGGCRHSSEACVELVVQTARRGVEGVGKCERPAVVWCYGSVRAVDEKRNSRCFPDPGICARDQARIATRSEWKDVTACAEIR